MRSTLASALAIGLLLCPPAGFADSSYQKTSQITGGQFIDSIKDIPLISKQMKQLTEPTSTITMVHGNQKAVVSRDSTEITDLDKQVVIHIDTAKKTYSVMTFADFRKMMQQMPQKTAQMQQQMKDAQAKQPAAPTNLQFKFVTTVTDPGPSKIINGQSAVQQIVTMKMIVTDADAPTTNIAYTMTTEVWTTPTLPAEMKDIQDFDMRFGQMLMAGVDLNAFKEMRANSQAAMGQMFGSKPGAAEAFAQMQKELAKIKGTRILEITRMGGSGTGMAPANASSAPTPAPGSNGSIAGQVATDTATQTAAGESSRLGIPGAALGSSIMGAFHRKKATPPPPPPAAAPATATGSPAPTDVVLMEMTEQTNNFSRDPIPASVFQVPAGFKLVQSPMAQAMAR